MTERTAAEALAEASYIAYCEYVSNASKWEHLQPYVKTIKVSRARHNIAALNSLGFDVVPIGDGR